MSYPLTLRTLLPALPAAHQTAQTFIGIDFGTSTTTVSCSVIGTRDKPIVAEAIRFQQSFHDGRVTESHLVPTAIAWKDDQLLIGQGAWQLKHKLKLGHNLWHSFKMQLGTDLGKECYQTVLGAGHPVATIERPQDAAKVFFRFIKQGIDRFVEARGLPRNVSYAVSVPAAFESNQRRDLLEALKAAGIQVAEHALIDEPNAAFLSYLAQYNADNLQGYQIPEDKGLHIMVFDFGAGTCDISVLEIGRGSQGFYSRNLAISRFVPLGGNDVDQAIARQILLPQVLQANDFDQDELRTPDEKRLLAALLGPAEQLKIRLCKTVAGAMLRQRLPKLAHSDERLTMRGAVIDITLAKKTLTVPELSLSYREFADLMEPFLDSDSRFDDDGDNDNSTFSIFTPIHSALDKAELNAEDLDMILLIGGSSETPYVQSALAQAFPETELEIPQDLRAHVSLGAAIHSQLLHGFGIDLIRPITSEPMLYLTYDGQMRTLVAAGTGMPSPAITIAGLRPHEDNQTHIEIPLFVSDASKLLQVIRIAAEPGQVFSRSTQVTLTATVSADKLVEIKAFVDGRPLHCDYLNPFINQGMTLKERPIYEALKKIHDEAIMNGGKPKPGSLRELAQAYAEADKHLRAAEVYESLQQLSPGQRYETAICYHYSYANKSKRSAQWAEIAYRKDPSAANAFNLALRKQHSDKDAYRRLMEEGLRDDPQADYLLVAYGEFLKQEGEEARGESMIRQAFDSFYGSFRSGRLRQSDYSRLIKAARLIGNHEVIQEVEKAQKELLQAKKDYDPKNLLEQTGDLLSNQAIKN